MAFTVKQLAEIAGVSVRTLHHYDEIGLLVPPVIGANGYRYYDERSALRLQSILFYRELEFPLSEIKELLDRPGFDTLDALQQQRRALEARRGRLDGLIVTIDNTIKHLKGESIMSTRQLFAGFTPEEEARHADEAARRWDPETVRHSQKKWAAYPAEKREAIKQEGQAIYQALAAAMPEGPESAKVQQFIERWRRHIEYFWTPNEAQLLGLADLYNDDPAFRANYDAIDPKLAPFMREAVKVYVQRRSHESGAR